MHAEQPFNKTDSDEFKSQWCIKRADTFIIARYLASTASIFFSRKFRNSTKQKIMSTSKQAW